MVLFIFHRLLILAFAQTFSVEKMDSLYSNTVVYLLFEWIIPILLIEPFVLILALKTMRKKAVQFAEIINLQINIVAGFFIISMLSKPMYLLGVRNMMALIESNNEVDTSGLIMVAIGLFILVITILFQPYYITSKQQLPLTKHVLNSIQIFVQFKWVVLGLMMYFLLFSIFVFQQGFLLISLFVPNYFHMTLAGIINSLQYTLFNVFLLKMFLYLKSFINLDCK